MGTNMTHEDFANAMQAGNESFKQNQQAKAAQELENQKADIAKKAGSENFDKLSEYLKGEQKAGRKVTGHVGASGDVSLSEAEPNPWAIQAKQTAQSAREAVNLSKEGEKTFKPIKDQLDAIENMEQLVQNPNSVSDSQLKAGLARLAEGPNQRLMQQVIQMSGASPSIAGDATQWANYLSGGALTKLQPAQKQAILDNLQTHHDLVKNQYSDVSNAFMAKAPQFAPTMAANGSLGDFSKNIVAPVQSKFDRRDAMRQQAAQQAQMQAKQPQQQAPQGVMDKLKNFLSPLSQQQPQQQAPAPQLPPQQRGQSMSPAPQQQPMAQPQQAQTGELSFEEFKKRKAAGAL